MYPHTTAQSRTNAGPCQPKRVLSMTRCSGSANAVNGMRITRLVSPGSIALTGDGVHQWASTPVTSNRDGGMCRRGSRISGSTAAGSTPVSSAASRIAVAGGPASPSSRAPPGKATSPAWSRSLGARCASRTSGPSAPSVAIRIRTAACRSAAASGTGSLRLSSSGRAAATASTRPTSDAGTTAGRRSVGASQRARSSISDRSTLRSLTRFLVRTQPLAPAAPDPPSSPKRASRPCVWRRAGVERCLVSVREASPPPRFSELNE